jgi:putative FmdB family regulatory protein
MPFYEYQCGRCGHHHEAMQKISDPHLRRCPACGRNALKRLMSAASFRLKGGGWYETDFKSDAESKRNLAAAEKAEGADKGEKGDKGDKGDKAEKTETAESSAPKTESSGTGTAATSAAGTAGSKPSAAAAKTPSGAARPVRRRLARRSHSGPRR